MAQTKQSNFSDDRQYLESRIEEIYDNRTPLSLILDSIIDPRNIGSLFRLSDGARIEHIYFYNCEINLNARHFRKTSRSTNKYLKFSTIDLEEIKSLREKSNLIAIEKTNDSKLYSSFNFETNTTFILGSEQKGVSQELLDLCKDAVHIPMLGINTSLNVANAAAIVIYEFVKKFKY